MLNQHIPPTDTAWFQRELDRLCKGKNLALRIQWAPTLNLLRVVNINGEIVPRLYKKYPLIERDTLQPVLNGFRFLRQIGTKTIQTMDGPRAIPNMVEVGYQKEGGIIEGNVLPSDMVEPDFEQVNPAIHIFVIEKRLNDEYARPMHERKRKLSVKYLGRDVYGEFPAEGVWDFWQDVSIHERDCCEMADELGLLCHGLYRPPGEVDLEAVRRALQKRDERPTVDVNLLIEQADRDMRASMAAYKQAQLDERLAAAREINRTAVRSITKPAIYLDPAKRDPRR